MNTVMQTTPAGQAAGTLSLPGTPAAPGDARRHITTMLGSHPAAAAVDWELLISEVVTNALIHTRSRQPGGTITVTIADNGAAVRVTVVDDGTDDDRKPHLADVIAAGDDQPGGLGLGLRMVAAMATAWAAERLDGGRTGVWFEVAYR